MKRKITQERFRDFQRIALKAKVNTIPPIKPEKVDPGYFTTQEIAYFLGIHLRKVQRAISHLLRVGLIQSKEFRIQASPINVRLIWHYRIKDQKAKAFLKKSLSLDVDQMLREKSRKK